MLPTNEIKLIGLDLDDTLLTPDKKITPRTMRAVRRAIDAGIVVLPATGRPLYGIPKEVRAIPGVRYALTTNGAKVYDMMEKDAVLHADCFDNGRVLDILNTFEDYDVLTSLFIEGRGFAEKEDFYIMHDMVRPEIQEYLVQSRTPVEDLQGYVLNSTDPVEKYSLFFHTEAERGRAKKMLEQRDDITVTYSISNNLEINTATANKGAALLELAKRLGIAPQQVMAAGDSSNDVRMIQAAGFGVAMGNAVDELKEHADYVTASNTEDGLADILEKVVANQS